jgi:hypothetical protein
MDGLYYQLNSGRKSLRIQFGIPFAGPAKFGISYAYAGRNQYKSCIHACALLLSFDGTLMQLGSVLICVIVFRLVSLMS